jgi:hypothetical protein
MLSEPLYYFDNKENVDPLTGRLSPSTKAKSGPVGVKRRVLGDITERERINRANMETLSACGMSKKKCMPTLIVTPTSRSSNATQASMENTAPSTPTAASATRRQANPRGNATTAQEKPFSKIYR